MIRAALPWVLGAAGVAAAVSCDTAPDPYTVIGYAVLAPLDAPGRPASGPLARPITGRLEILATGDAAPPPPDQLDIEHVVAAYKVALPDGAAPWVRIFDATSCAAPGDDPLILADLGLIRRVDGETHFFRRHVSVDGTSIAVDTQIAQLVAPVGTGDPVFDTIGKIAVVMVPGEDRGNVPDPTGCPMGSGSDPPPPPSPGCGDGGGSAGYPPGGPWLACGVFVLD